jgi:hypothetical protein
MHPQPLAPPFSPSPSSSSRSNNVEANNLSFPISFCKKFWELSQFRSCSHPKVAIAILFLGIYDLFILFYFIVKEIEGHHLKLETISVETVRSSAHNAYSDAAQER